MKHNNNNQTADILLKESELEKVFLFPNEFYKDSKNESEQLKKKFIEYFYYNSFIKENPENSNILSEFWNQFWEIFVNKIKQSNKTSTAMTDFLSANKLKLSCKFFFMKFKILLNLFYENDWLFLNLVLLKNFILNILKINLTFR